MQPYKHVVLCVTDDEFAMIAEGLQLMCNARKAEPRDAVKIIDPEEQGRRHRELFQWIRNEVKPRENTARPRNVSTGLYDS